MNGTKFGRWTVIERGPKSNTGLSRWLCKCECGTTKNVDQSSLTRGLSVSCGCYKTEQTILSARHGRTKTPLHHAWVDMRQRCNNKNNSAYHNYGGRGITVCAEWDNSFESFMVDMGDLPFEGAQIDRIDNSKGYSPDNCHWTTHLENARNTRKNRILNHNGVSQCISEWAESIGMKYGTLQSRIQRGWSDEKAISTPAWEDKSMNLNDRTISALQHRTETYQQLESSILPYTINWAAVLQDDTISTSTWDAPNMTIPSQSNTTSSATAKLAASPGTYSATNTITTAAGLTDSRSIKIEVKRTPETILQGDYDD